MKKVLKGMAPADSTLAIVERELELRSDSGDSKVFVRLRRPVPGGEATFRCDAEIEGLGELISPYAEGVDAIQAYELALRAVALHLLSSPAYQSGRLTFRGTYDLDLPCSGSYSCLVRLDLERERVVREFAGTDEA